MYILCEGLGVIMLGAKSKYYLICNNISSLKTTRNKYDFQVNWNGTDESMKIYTMLDMCSGVYEINDLNIYSSRNSYTYILIGYWVIVVHI